MDITTPTLLEALAKRPLRQVGEDACEVCNISPDRWRGPPPPGSTFKDPDRPWILRWILYEVLGHDLTLCPRCAELLYKEALIAIAREKALREVAEQERLARRIKPPRSIGSFHEDIDGRKNHDVAWACHGGGLNTRLYFALKIYGLPELLRPVLVQFPTYEGLLWKPRRKKEKT